MIYQSKKPRDARLEEKANSYSRTGTGTTQEAKGYLKGQRTSRYIANKETALEKVKKRQTNDRRMKTAKNKSENRKETPLGCLYVQQYSPYTVRHKNRNKKSVEERKKVEWVV